jgi:translation elongation factor EF-Ts
MSQTEKALRKSIEAMIKAREALKKTAAEIEAEKERLRKAGLAPLAK